MQGTATWILTCTKVTEQLPSVEQELHQLLFSNWFCQENLEVFGVATPGLQTVLWILPWVEIFQGALLALKFRFKLEQGFTIAVLSPVQVTFGQQQNLPNYQGLVIQIWEVNDGSLLLGSSALVSLPENYFSEGFTRWLWKTEWCDLFLLGLSYV